MPICFELTSILKKINPLLPLRPAIEKFSLSDSCLIKSMTASTDNLPTNLLFSSTTGAVTKSYLSKAFEASSAKSSGLNRTISYAIIFLTFVIGGLTMILSNGNAPKIKPSLSTTNNLSV